MEVARYSHRGCTVAIMVLLTMAESMAGARAGAGAGARDGAMDGEAASIHSPGVGGGCGEEKEEEVRVRRSLLRSLW